MISNIIITMPHPQCLKRLADESKADEMMVISLWRHELTRIIRDKISRTSDLNWFDDKLDAIISAVKKVLLKFSFLYFNLVNYLLLFFFLQKISIRILSVLLINNPIF